MKGQGIFSLDINKILRLQVALDSPHAKIVSISQTTPNFPQNAAGNRNSHYRALSYWINFTFELDRSKMISYVLSVTNSSKQKQFNFKRMHQYK